GDFANGLPGKLEPLTSRPLWFNVSNPINGVGRKISRQMRFFNWEKPFWDVVANGDADMFYTFGTMSCAIDTTVTVNIGRNNKTIVITSDPIQVMAYDYYGFNDNSPATTIIEEPQPA